MVRDLSQRLLEGPAPRRRCTKRWARATLASRQPSFEASATGAMPA